MPSHTVSMQEKLQSVLQEHIQLVLRGKPLEATLEQLMIGATQLVETPRSLAMVRVQEPYSVYSRHEIARGAWVEEADKLILEAMELRELLKVDNMHLAEADVPHSALVAPFVLGDTCYGGMFLGSDRTSHFKPQALTWIKILADQAVQTLYIERVRSGSSLLTAEDISIMEPDRILSDLQKLAERYVASFPKEQLSIEILGATSESDALVTLGSATNSAIPVLPGYYASSASLAWQAFIKNEPIPFRNVHNGDLRTSNGSTRSALVLPLRDKQNNAIGVLSVETPKPRGIDGLADALQPIQVRAESIICEASDEARNVATSLRSVLLRVGAQLPNLLNTRRLSSLYKPMLRRIVQMIGQPDAEAAIAFCGDGVFTITVDAIYNYPRDLIQVWSWPQNRGLTGLALRERRSICIPDVHAPDLAGIYFEQDPNAVSELVVPLMRSNKILGVIDIVSAKNDAFSKRHQEYVEAFAHQALETLERARDIRSGWLAQENIRLLQDTNKEIAHMLRTDESSDTTQDQERSQLRSRRRDLLQHLVSDAVKYTGSSVGVILAGARLPANTDDPTSAEAVELVEMAAIPPRADSGPVIHIPVGRSPQNAALAAFRRNGAVQYSDSLPPNMVGIMLGSNAKSTLAIPIPGGDRVLGIICLESSVRRMYSPAQVKRVELLASQAANVIAAANLYLYRKKLRSILNLIDEVMTTSLTRVAHVIHQAIHDRILQVARELTEQDDGYSSLWLVGDGGRPMLVKNSAGREGSEIVLEQTHHRASIVELALKRQRPVVVLDVDDQEYGRGFRPSFPESKSEIAVPLLNPDAPDRHRSRVIGILCVGSRNKAAFSGREVSIMEILAQIAVTSIRLSSMYYARLEFLRDISHDTPRLARHVDSILERLELNAINAVLAHSENTLLVKNYELLERGFALLSTFIECFHELAEYEANEASAPLEYVSLASIARELIEDMVFYSDDGSRTIRLISHEEDVIVYCRRDLIKVALFVLLHNAIKYAPHDSEIQVRVIRTDKNRGRIEVADKGSPIPPKQRSAIFERNYSRSHSSHVARGSGIGLDHARRISFKIHGGWAGYRRDRGLNVFYIELPINKGPQSIVTMLD